MTASELITQLQTLVEIHGDLDCMSFDESGDIDDINLISYKRSKLDVGGFFAPGSGVFFIGVSDV